MSGPQEGMRLPGTRTQLYVEWMSVELVVAVARWRRYTRSLSVVAVTTTRRQNRKDTSDI